MLQEWHSAPRYCPVPWQWWSFFSAVSKDARHSLSPVLQLLPPGHADRPSSASPGEVVVGQLEKVVQHGPDCVVLVAVPLVVREPQPQLLGRHVAAAPDGDVAGRSRDGLARRLLLRYVDRRGGRAVDLEVRVARQGRELCGGLAPVAQQALLGPGQRHFPSALGYLSIALGGAAALPRGLRGEAGHAPRALVLHAAAGVGGRGSQGQPLPAGQRLEVVDQAVVAAVQEKQHGVPDDARAARGALLEDVVVLQPVRPQGLLPHEDEDLHPPGARRPRCRRSSRGGPSAGQRSPPPRRPERAASPGGAVLGGRPARGRRRGPEQLVALDRWSLLSPSTPRQCARTHHMKQRWSSF